MYSAVEYSVLSVSGISSLMQLLCISGIQPDEEDQTKEVEVDEEEGAGQGAVEQEGNDDVNMLENSSTACQGQSSCAAVAVAADTDAAGHASTAAPGNMPAKRQRRSAKNGCLMLMPVLTGEKSVL